MQKYQIMGRSSEGIKIAALADLHGEMLGKKQERIIKKLQIEKPDLIVYLGDMIDRTKPEESSLALTVLTEQLIEIAPVYYVDGNHETDIQVKHPDIYVQLNENLESLGAVHIENEIMNLIVNKSNNISSKNILEDKAFQTESDYIQINICGITTHYYWENEEYVLADNLRRMHGINIMICHYPESILWYHAFGNGGLDLALCGHTHGGLIRIPFVGGVYAPEEGKWPLYDWGAYPIFSDTGWRHYGGAEDSEYLGTMIISGGLSGEHGIPRFNNPKEISIIEITK